MKYFDIVNKNDEIIGKKTVKECHSDPSLIHRVLHFTLVDPKTNKFLITQRSFDVKFDSGKWCFMGEHVLSGNSYEDALIKGVKDELGVDLKTFKEIGNNIFTYDTQTEFVRFFVVEWNGEELEADSREIIDFKWMTLDELKQNKDSYSIMTKYWVKNVDWNLLTKS